MAFEHGFVARAIVPPCRVLYEITLMCVLLAPENCKLLSIYVLAHL